MVDRIEKKCFKCCEIKSINMFYGHIKMPDGHVNKCIECTKKEAKQRYRILSKDEEWIERERKRCREKNKKDLTRMPRYFEKYPEKKIAKNKSSHIKIALKGGEKHHWSYRAEHAKDIIELSKRDHEKAHRFIIYDQERQMYRTIDGILLDTRDAHHKYIMGKIKNKRL